MKFRGVWQPLAATTSKQRKKTSSQYPTTTPNTILWMPGNHLVTAQEQMSNSTKQPLCNMMENPAKKYNRYRVDKITGSFGIFKIH